MARKKQSAEKRPAQKKNSAPLKRHRPAEAEVIQDGLLDDTTKRDIIGISFIICAIVFLLVVALPADGALVTSFASEWMRLLFGVGAYLLPVILAGIGATFLYRSQKQRVPARAAVGLTVVFISLLGLIATFTPTTSLGSEDLQLLFLDANLVAHGGYVGAGLAFCGMSLFGRVITAVIFIGLMVIGLVIVGFSVSRTIERVRAKKRQLEEKRASDPSASFGSRKLRVRKADDVAMRAPASVHASGAALAHGGAQNLTQPLLADPAALTPDPPNPAAQRIVAAKSMLGDPSVHAVDEAATTRPLACAPLPWEDSEPVAAIAPAPEPLPSASQVRSDPSEVFIPLPNLAAFDQGVDAEEDAPAPAPDAFTRLSAWNGRAEKNGGPHAADDLAASLPRIGEGGVTVPGISRASMPSPIEEPAHRPHTDTVRLDDEQEAPPAAAADAPRTRKKATGKKDAACAPGPGQAGSGIIRDGFELPSRALLKAPGPADKAASSGQDLSQTAHTLQQTLEDFGINASVVGWIEGPTVTLFQVDLPSGVRVSRITNLNDDIALALASPGVRIFAPIPGTNHVGIEIPNRTRQTVFLSEVLESAGESPLDIAIGKDVEGRAIVSDLAKMPHLLIGGTTGSGKSVSINAMIMSILMRATPDEVRFIMIDPKRVEFTPYNGIPHLYVPVVTEPKEAASALSWGVAEMERRLKIFSKIGVRNITQYNAKVSGGGVEDGEGRELDPLPYIVIIIDELADLMMNVGKEVEFSISRIAQLARAAGIHLIVATQRPSTNVVTGLIKANITNRIAFNVASGIDSRVILDTPGAESLIGLGDMLLSKPELPKPQRIQACFVSEEEIEAVVDFIKRQGEPDYHQDILNMNVMSLGDTSPQGGSGTADDPLIWEAAELVVSSRMGSTSNIQRRLKVGYARAGRIMDQLEELGVVGPANGSKPREVYLDELELESLKAFENND